MLLHLEPASGVGQEFADRDRLLLVVAEKLVDCRVVPL
jgi:hypothetical protein